MQFEATYEAIVHKNDTHFIFALTGVWEIDSHEVSVSASVEIPVNIATQSYGWGRRAANRRSVLYDSREVSLG